MISSMHHAGAWPWPYVCGAALCIWLAALGAGLRISGREAAVPGDEVCEAQIWDRAVEAGETRRGSAFVSVLDHPSRHGAARGPRRGR